MPAQTVPSGFLRREGWSSKTDGTRGKTTVRLLWFLFVVSLCVLFLELYYYIIPAPPLPKEVSGWEIGFFNQSFSQMWKFDCKNKPFKGILLVVTFNFPLYSNIAVLSEVYDLVFEKVLYCGVKPTNEEAGGPTLEASVGNGYFGYDCMKEAITKHPGYQGYLYVNDDMIVNWWNLLKFDRHKVWQGAEIVDFSQEATGDLRIKEWIWWTTAMGQSSCQKSYLEIKSMADSGRQDFDASRHLKIYLKNGGGVARCGKGWSDFFYVPGHLASAAKNILSIHREHSLFLEISVNNMLRSLDYVENFEMVKGVYLPDIGVYDSSDGKEFWKHYNTKITFIHPFKLHFEQYKTMNLALFRNWVVSLTRRLTSCAEGVQS